MASNASYHQKRALVIGIDDYIVNPLGFCVRDAQALSTALESIGFSVTQKCNVGASEFNSCVVNFAKGIRSTDLTLFYFAGHAKQTGSKSYLLFSNGSILVQGIIEQFRNRCLVTIFMFDCARKSMNSSQENIEQNLSYFKALPGTIIASTYCHGAAPRSESCDGKNGHFMQSLLPHIKSNKNIVDVLTSVAVDLDAITGMLKAILISNGLQDAVFLNASDFMSKRFHILIPSIA